MFVFVVDGSLFEFAYETPAFVLALLFERYTTRPAEVGEIYRFGFRGPGEAPALVYRFRAVAYL